MDDGCKVIAKARLAFGKGAKNIWFFKGIKRK
jgi:hypothetical protein